MRRGGPRAGDECHSDGQRRSADARTAALHALHAAPCRSSATPSSRRGRVCLGESDEKVYACEVFSRRDGADPASTRALFQLIQGAAAGAALERRYGKRVVSGTSVSVREDSGVGGDIKKKKIK